MPNLTIERPAPRQAALDQFETPRQQLRSDHLGVMLTDIGLWQHAEGTAPNPRHGYSIDDEARGLIVGLRYRRTRHSPRFYDKLAGICFRFIADAAITEGHDEGRYHNFCDDAGLWLDSVGSDDSFGRTVWGLGVAHAADASFAPRAEVEALLLRSLPQIDTLKWNYLRARAFVILGLAEARIADDKIKQLADYICDAYEKVAVPEWQWFEEQMTYCNPRLPQALFVAARLFPEEPRYARIATESLDFLRLKTRNDHGSYDPVGNDRMTEAGWFTRHDAHPPLFDQQPVDAGALVECCVDAWHTTQEPRFRQAAGDAYEWYNGANCHRLLVHNPETGGVSDALTRHALNRNQGAESVLSIHLAHQALLTL